MASDRGQTESDVLRWTARLRAQGRPLFSRELRPQLSITDALGVHASGKSRFVVDPVLLDTLVHEVVLKRRAMVAGFAETHFDMSDVRRLCWYPEYTDFISLGLETGIVDGCDAPAWDLWTAVECREGQLCLLAAVPSWLECLAARAISLTPAACLQWE